MVAALMVVSGAVVQAEERLPNIILIFIDDQGYQDLGCYGSPIVKTPNLDRMAREGTRFTDFYALAPICSASRAALLTGCYPARVGITGVLFPRHRVGLNPDEWSIARLLKTRDYATACIGKWHLGHHSKFLPTNHGFDQFYGLPYSNDMDPVKGMGKGRDLAWRERDVTPWNVPLMRDTVIVERPAQQGTLTKRYTEEAVQFVESNAEKPFFLYLPHTMPHIPLFVSDEFYDPDPMNAYAATIAEIDWSVGKVLEAVERLGLDEETLVVYTSDNGPWLSMKHHGGSALPLRDGKFSTYEGGMRVPCIMRWPGRIPAGRVAREIGASIDLLPTFAHLAGIELPTDRVIDGVNIASWIQGQSSSPREELFYYKGEKVQAVRKGPWKLNLARVQKRRNRPDIATPASLHYLPDDISEAKNVIEENSAVAEQLSMAASLFDQSLRDQSRLVGSLEPWSDE